MANGRPCPVDPDIVPNGADDMLSYLRPSFFKALPSPRPQQLARGLALPSTATWTDHPNRSPGQKRYNETHARLEPLGGSVSHIRAQPTLHTNRLSIDDLLSSDYTSPIVVGRRSLPSRPYHTSPVQISPSYQRLPVSYFSPPDGEQDRSIARPQLEHRSPQNPQIQWPHQEHNISRLSHSSPSYSAPGQLHGSAETPIHSPLPSHRSFDSEPTPARPGDAVYSSVPRVVSRSPPLKYRLTVRQQPVAARACGFGERDRRVVDPPPIVQLKISNEETGAPEQDPNAMLAIHCRLISVDFDSQENKAEATMTHFNSTQRLMGTSVASPYQAKDEYGVAGTFFVFSDLSCRMPGKYRLQFILLRVDPTMMLPGMKHGTVASIETDIFSVYTAKDFPGMQYSSALLRALRSQGLNVSLKRGTEARMMKGKRRKGSMRSDTGDGRDKNDEPRIYSY